MLKVCIFLLIPFLVMAQQNLPPQQQQTVQKPPPITPPNGPLRNHLVDVVVDAEFLWWYATCTNLPYATKYRISDQGNTFDPTARTVLPQKIYEMDWDWDKGVRVGLGFVMRHDGWDVFADWTYTYNDTRDRKEVAPIPSSTLTSTNNPFGTEVLATPWAAFGASSPFTRVNSHWSLLFHQIDLELGRKFWISHNLSLRPFGGVRGHWSRMFFKTKGTLNTTRASSPIRFMEETDRRRQKFWAVGLLGGLDTAWHFSQYWSIFIDGAVALLYGPFDQHTRFQQFSYTISNQVISEFNRSFHHDDIYTVQAVYDLAIGFRWELTMYDDRFRIRFDAGWESHLWPSFNQFDVQTSASSDTGTFLPANGNLILTGLVLRGRFEF